MASPSRSITASISSSRMQDSPATRSELDERCSRIKSMKTNLRFHRILIGRERPRSMIILCRLRRRPVKRDHHQMQVDGERVHHHNFDRVRAHQAAVCSVSSSVIGHPRILRVEMAFDTKCGPVLQFLLDVRCARSSAAVRANARTR